MLFLLFELDDERYALEATMIAEVRPFAPARALPGTPAWVAGVIERHGEAVPVIDVAQLALGRPAQALRSTRLVLVRYRAATAPESDNTPLLGLILERATQTRQYTPEQFAESGVATPDARWLGPVARDGDGFVQWLKVEQLLDERVRALLFPVTPSWQQEHAS